MQAVDVLREQRAQRAALLEPDERPVTVVRLCRPRSTVEAVLPRSPPDLRIAHVVLERRRLLGSGILRPDAVGTTEVRIRYRNVARSQPALLIRGRLEASEGVYNVIADKIEPLPVAAAVPSRDFR